MNAVKHEIAYRRQFEASHQHKRRSPCCPDEAARYLASEGSPATDAGLDVPEPIVRAMMDALAARRRFFRALLDEHPDRFVPVLVDAALTSVTEKGGPE